MKCFKFFFFIKKTQRWRWKHRSRNSISPSERRRWWRRRMRLLHLWRQNRLLPRSRVLGGGLLRQGLLVVSIIGNQRSLVHCASWRFAVVLIFIRTQVSYKTIFFITFFCYKIKFYCITKVLFFINGIT